MERSLKLGAINKESGEYVNVSYALKNNKYICPECESDVILRKGEKNRVHFAHKKDGNCEYYEKPTESQIHKDGKMLIKMLVEKNQLEVYKRCNECNERTEIILPIYENNKTLILEHRFNFDIIEEGGGILKIADVAYLDENKKIIWICEILNTHKTEEGNRPEPWNEIDAKELLKKKIKEDEKVEINCCRKYICEKCFEKRYKELDKKDLKELLNSEHLKWFIRYKLCLYLKSNKLEIDSNNYNCEKDNIKNKFIVDIFKNFYDKKNVYLVLHKGYFYINFGTSIPKNMDHIEIYDGEEYDKIYANPNEHYVYGSYYDIGNNYCDIIEYILTNIGKEYVLINYDNKKSEEYYTNLLKERIYLSVKYEDKEEIKKKGGLWDIESKKWYILKTNEKIVQILKKYEIIQMFIKKIKNEFIPIEIKKDIEYTNNIIDNNSENCDIFSVEKIKKDIECMNNIIDNNIKIYEKIYTKEEIDKNKFNINYYEKYHKALLSIKKNIPLTITLSDIKNIKKKMKNQKNYLGEVYEGFIWRELYGMKLDNWISEVNWNYDEQHFIKKTMYDFLKYYKIKNPVTLVKELRKEIEIDEDKNICLKAKLKLKEWFDKSEKDDYKRIGDIRFRSNRKSGVFLDYPICKNIKTEIIEYSDGSKTNNKKIYYVDSSWESNWDEISGVWDEYVPSKTDCINIYESTPIDIIDIVCSHKGSPRIGIEIYNKYSTSKEKINRLKKAGVNELIEIDAEWILSRKEIPNNLEYNRLI